MPRSMKVWIAFALVALVAIMLSWRHMAADNVRDIGTNGRPETIVTTSRQPTVTPPQPTATNGSSSLNARRATIPASGTPIHIRIPENTPVATVLKELRSAADAGDSRAACRVGIELARCLRIGSKSSAAERALCEGVTSDDANQAWKYLLQAAATGNVAAMSRYARDPGLTTTNPADSAEGWLTYKQNAPTFLNQAVQGGDVMALYFSWWNSATGFSSGGDHVFQQNPYMAMVYGNAVLPLLDPRRQNNVIQLNAKIQASVPADQLAQAQAEGQRIRDTYFAGAERTPDTIDDSYVPPAKCDN